MFGIRSLVALLAACAGIAHAQITRTGTITNDDSGSCAQATMYVPDGPDDFGGCFPGTSNTGYSGSLTTYSGPCTITVANTTIDSKQIDCDITVHADNLAITNSLVNGYVNNDDNGTGYHFTITDSIVDADALQAPGAAGYRNIRAICCQNFTVLRSEIRNSTGLVACNTSDNNYDTSTVQDSYLHGIDLRDPDTLAHASALRIYYKCTITHNSLHCDYTGPFNNSDIGCSADMTQYPQDTPNHHNDIERNLFVDNEIGNAYCAYGAGSGGAFLTDPLNGVQVKFIDNVFKRGTAGTGLCGDFEPIGDWHLPLATGQEWTNNKFDDGTVFQPGGPY